MQLSIGDRLPAILGATAPGGFYSLDAQAGRPAVLVALGGLEPQAAGSVLQAIDRAQAPLQRLGVDLVPLAPAAAALDWAAVAGPETVYVAEAGALELSLVDGRPAAFLIDRAGRIVDIRPVDGQSDLAAVFATSIIGLFGDEGRMMTSSAPALIIPNLASASLCQALIAHFEASPHTPGVMASVGQDGRADAKLDEGKKRRRDIELTADSPLYAQVLEVLAGRCLPEIKRAFQKDMAYLDRILIARYDDTGGYFRRHRDNAAPHTRFREFAISLNLNTHDYEGGELLFPEYDDHRYSPSAGSAIVFSASLLHEAAPVLRGSRYVLLSFFCSAPATA